MKTRLFQISALLLLALLIFSAGRGGSFMLDDVANLKTLERLSSPLSFEAVSSVVFTNESGFGRIIPMASFVLQFQSWPQDPGSFRMVNLAIHLFNGLLVWLFVRKLLSQSANARTIERLALCATAIWLLHPLQVSTVLYIVQRSAELSATFTLIGLLLYLRGRTIATDRPISGYFLMGLSTVGMTTLAVLCKENGLLLPLYILLLEFTVLAQETPPPYHRVFLSAVFVPPLAAGIWFAAVYALNWLLSAYSIHDFTMSERLLTEGRVLVDYLKVIILPPVSGLGVFHDDFPISRSVFSPVSTFWCLLLLAGLASIGIACRKRLPLVSFGLLWFFVAHSMESTVIPLEIYFEHRNYLAILGPALVLCLGGNALLNHAAAQGLRYFFSVLFVLWFGYISFITWHESRLWGKNQWTIAETWAHDHPDSLRAQSFLANTLAAEGFTRKAASMFETLAEGSQHSAGAYLNWLSLGCKETAVGMPDRSRMEQALRQTKYSAGIINALERFVIMKENHACVVADEDILLMFEATLANPQFNRQKFSLYVLMGRLQSAAHQTDAAVTSFEQAFKLKKDVEVALLQAKTLAEVGRYEEALAKLPLAEAANKSNTLGKQGYALDIENWRLFIEKSMSSH